MPVLPGGPGDTLNDIYLLAQSLLNDPAFDQVTGLAQDPSIYTTFRLNPFVNKAYRRFQKDLAAHGVKVNKADVVQTFAPGFNAWTVEGPPPATAIQLPADFVFAHYLKERPTGSSVDYTEMTRQNNGIPARLPQAALLEYETLGGNINFIGATNPVDVLMRYESRFSPLVAPADRLQVGGAVEALASLSCYYAANARGTTAKADGFLADYKEELNLWISTFWNPQQRTPARRRAYGGRRRVRY